MQCGHSGHSGQSSREQEVEEGRKENSSTYLHDKLNGANEVSQELEKQILLLFLHLVQTVLLATGVYFGFCKTNASIGLELVLWNDASTAWSGLLLVLIVLGVAILGLELVDQSVHVLVFFVILNGLIARRRGIVLLVEVARLDLR
jgi:hypothetical protein